MKCILTEIPIAKVGSNNGLEKIMQNLDCSKILSFECSKYEMKGGKRLFEGESNSILWFN